MVITQLNFKFKVHIFINYLFLLLTIILYIMIYSLLEHSGETFNTNLEMRRIALHNVSHFPALVGYWVFVL
jgi:hypothetical protein